RSVLLLAAHAGDHRALHSFPTRRSSDLVVTAVPKPVNAVAMMPPSEPVVAAANQLPTCSRMPNAHSSGKKMATDNRLYMSCTERSEEHTSELQSRFDLVCRLLLEKKNNN